MPITRRSTLPQNYEDRLARIYCNVLNSATNSVVMLYLKGNEQSLPELREVLDGVNPFFTKKRPSDLKAIISGSLCRAGVDSKIDGEDVWYTLNEEGHYLVRPLAAHILIWFYNNPDCCPEVVFGKDCGPTNAPYQRARMMVCVNELSRELLASMEHNETSIAKTEVGLEFEQGLNLDQICEKVGMKKPDAQHILYKIADTGLIVYEHQDATKDFMFYRWKGENLDYPQIKWIAEGKWIGEGVVTSIVDYLYARRKRDNGTKVDRISGDDLRIGELGNSDSSNHNAEGSDTWVSPRQIWKELNLSQRNFAYAVVSALYKQGYLEQKKGEMRKAQIKASPQLNNLCGLLSDINQAVRESISNTNGSVNCSTNGKIDSNTNRYVNNGTGGSVKSSRNIPPNLLRTMQLEAEKLTDGSRESRAILDEMIRRHVEALRR